MNTKRIITALIVLIFGLVVSGVAFAGPGSEEPAGAKEMTLRINADPGIIDPTKHWLYDLPANQWVSLVEYDYVNSGVVPAGATSWDISADGKVWTFNIRRNWTWSNGDPVTAHDYEYSFQRIVDPETASVVSWRIFVIENAAAINAGDMAVDSLGVKATDDYTLEITINEPSAWFLSSLTSIGHAVHQETVEQYGGDWTQPGNTVVGGPYMVTEWVVDDYVVLEKNPNYYDADNVDIEKITLLIVPAASTAMAMFENGELDVLEAVPPEDLDRVRNDPELSAMFYNGPAFRLDYYGFGANSPPFDNVLVRKAFIAAIDKATLTEKITRGGQVPASTITPPGSVGHVPASAEVGIPFDVDQAQAYLEEAGFPGGAGLAPIKLGYNATEINANVAQAIQKMWSDNLGVDVELAGIEGGTYNSQVGVGAFQVWRGGWGMDYPDAQNTLGEIFRSKPRAGDEAHKFLFMPEFDALVDEAAVEMDAAKRNELYVEAERLLVEEHAAATPLFWFAMNRLTRPHINRPDVPTMNLSWKLWSIDE